MAKNNPVYNKAFSFAISIVNLYKHLTSEKKEYDLSRQLLRSGTSIGANVLGGTASSRVKETSGKNEYCPKGAAETEYWLKLLIATDYPRPSKIPVYSQRLQKSSTDYSSPLLRLLRYPKP